jgi:hypothetical protein
MNCRPLNRKAVHDQLKTITLGPQSGFRIPGNTKTVLFFPFSLLFSDFSLRLTAFPGLFSDFLFLLALPTVLSTVSTALSAPFRVLFSDFLVLLVRSAVLSTVSTALSALFRVLFSDFLVLSELSAVLFARLTVTGELLAFQSLAFSLLFRSPPCGFPQSCFGSRHLTPQPIERKNVCMPEENDLLLIQCIKGL